jgi:peptidoglycan DL-endopeptidase CwlO
MSNRTTMAGLAAAFCAATLLACVDDDLLSQESDRQLAAEGPSSAAAACDRSAAGEAVAFAEAQIGKPYELGAEGPSTYDDSGLTRAAWRAAGVSLPHSAVGQYEATAPAPGRGLGDLVFLEEGHLVAIYVGDGKMVLADSTSGVVRLELAPAGEHPIGRPCD